MYFILLLLIIFLIIICILNYLIYRHKRKTYLKAGKKWEEIVKELSERK